MRPRQAVVNITDEGPRPKLRPEPFFQKTKLDLTAF
jgi:hypothetical protein